MFKYAISFSSNIRSSHQKQYPIKLAPKISGQHIYLNSYSAMGMRVKFPTQILNEPVEKLLDRFGNMEMETI